MFLVAIVPEKRIPRARNKLCEVKFSLSQVWIKKKNLKVLIFEDLDFLLGPLKLGRNSIRISTLEYNLVW